MSRRYVFWRSSDGTPDRTRDSKYAPKARLAHLGNSATVKRDGVVSWPGFSFQDLPIRSALVVLDAQERELNTTDAWSIGWRTIVSIIKKQGGGQPVRPADVIKEADPVAAAHFRLPPREYALVSSLSIRSFPATQIRVSDCKISAMKERGNKFPYPPMLELQAKGTPISLHLEATRYQFVKVKTVGRTTHEATDRALDSLNLLRGLWSLFATYGSWSMSFGKPRQLPIGVIHIGPIQTLHDLDGTLAGKDYWYVLDYTGDQDLFVPKKGWEPIEKHRKWAAARINRLPYKNELEHLIIRYVSALDHSNLDIAFLQMWGILEKLTDTIGAKYDETIRRATWFYSDRDLARDDLSSLRRQRNQFVHSGKSGESRDQIVYMLKRFVEPHLLRLIRNDFGIQNLREYAECLSLPNSVQVLKERRKRLSCVIRVLK